MNRTFEQKETNKTLMRQMYSFTLSAQANLETTKTKNEWNSQVFEALQKYTFLETGFFDENSSLLMTHLQIFDNE